MIECVERFDKRTLFFSSDCGCGSIVVCYDVLCVDYAQSVLVIILAVAKTLIYCAFIADKNDLKALVLLYGVYGSQNYLQRSVIAAHSVNYNFHKSPCIVLIK